jgi:predicted phosphodiesterase
MSGKKQNGELIGVIGDIHSNLTAFKAVFSYLSEVSKVWCLGDIVGYGPNPEECLEHLTKFDHITIAGNHDLGAIGKIDLMTFNTDARIACAWSGEKLSQQGQQFLADLPLTLNPKPEILLVHGTPNDPVWEYLLSAWQADAILTERNEKFVFVAHSHLPFVIEKVDQEPSVFKPIQPGETITLDQKESVRYIINPGSIGQPRDGDPRASFMLFDLDNSKLKYYRVAYQISETQERMRQAGLPRFLIERLAVGM